MARCTMLVNKLLMSVRAVGYGSLVDIQDKINRAKSEHAFSGKLTFQIPYNYAGRVFVLMLAKQNTA